MEWISVSDRLPEDETYVLVCSKAGVYLNAHCIINGRWYGYGESFSIHKNISHWVPLPQPPKEGERNE